MLGPRGRDGGVKEGEKLRVLMAPVPGAPGPQPIRVIVANEASVEAVVALSDMGKYGPVDAKNFGDLADNIADNLDQGDKPGVIL